MFRLRRNGEFVLPPCRRHFASESPKHRGFCEATSLKTLGPHVQNTRNPGDLQGDLESPCTRFFLVRFFDARQKNEQQAYKG